jgi:deoxyribodipyrimidine photolyase-related protein
MQRFYQWQRKRLGILLEPNQKPTGGKWSFDSENRKKLPKDIAIPPLPNFKRNDHVTEAISYIEKNFANNVGTTTAFQYATTFTEAERCLEDFLRHRLANFGPYEDAIDERSHTLFHSVLSPYINIGLLTPEQVVQKTLAFAHQPQQNIPLASLEGFIRQVIGWREYMRFVYDTQGTKIRNSNYFKAHKHLTPEYWTGITGIAPIDDTVKTLLDTAYAHHIPRLMILGNWMNLCGIHPDGAYQWFMELFIDAYDWVMVPNVYSMALYADGGLITTKPYISGSNYIRSMSHYKKDPPGTIGWSSRWDALYWYFIDRHYDKLEKENRLGFAGVQYRKLSAEQLQTYRSLAKQTMQQLTSNT